MDCSLPGSSVHGISQARVLEWIAISFYKVSSQPKDRSHGPKIHLMSPALQADSLPLSCQGSPYLLYSSLKSLNFCLKNFVTCPEHHFNNNPDDFLKKRVLSSASAAFISLRFPIVTYTFSQTRLSPDILK